MFPSPRKSFLMFIAINPCSCPQPEATINLLFVYGFVISEHFVQMESYNIWTFVSSCCITAAAASPSPPPPPFLIPFLLLFFFWLPHGIWSSQARDQIQAQLQHVLCWILNSLLWVRDQICIPVLQR